MTQLGEIKQTFQFEFSPSFRREFECIMKLYDGAYAELSKVLSSTTVNIPDEYGICNNNYKLRYIKPENIASYISYLMKALSKDLISYNINDLEKFSVQCVKNFMNENGCIPIENSSIYGLYRYTSDTMTLKDLILLCENDVYHTSVCSKYDITQRKSSMKQDWNTLVNLHFSTNIKNMVNAIPNLMKSTEYSNFDMYVRDAICACVESFILFSITINAITMSNMTLYCVPKSTYNTSLIDKRNQTNSNSSLEENDMKDTFVEQEEPKPKYHSIVGYVTECCLLKTNNIMLNNKIPFNINMRDIVLQDMHPQFKDTNTAIHFITKDTRSPISKLLIKYASNEPKHIYVDPMTIINLFSHNRCHSCMDRDVYKKYHDIDFHTDVNWLDKIAYGNNYLNGNYRTDGMGNQHMDPIVTSLDTLYRMYGDCALVNSKELADHIIKVSSLMKGIILAYVDCQIQNWEMVRDILAVLGEIMTRCMIKLYNNHMTVFVARDDMDDTMIPGYLYTESFVMEADNNKPRIDVMDSNTGDKKSQNFIQKAKQFISQLYHRFIAWVHSVLEKAPVKFNNEHKRESDWVTKNQKLNQEIAEALDRDFFISVTNFPHYKIPANDLINTKTSMVNIVKEYIASLNNEVNESTPNVGADKLYQGVSATAIKWQIYPQKLATKISSLVQQNNGNFDVKQERIWVTNYILYGDPDHEYVDHNPTRLQGRAFNDLITNITNTGKLLETKVSDIQKDLGEALELAMRECKRLEQIQKTNNNQSENDTENKGNVENVDKKLDDMKVLQDALKDITSSYYVALENVIASKFYATSYALYRDVVTAYQQQQKSKSNKESQPTNEPANPTEPATGENNTDQQGVNGNG